MEEQLYVFAGYEWDSSTSLSLSVLFVSLDVLFSVAMY